MAAAPCLVYDPSRNAKCCFLKVVRLRICISRGVCGNASAEATRRGLHGAANRGNTLTMALHLSPLPLTSLSGRVNTCHYHNGMAVRCSNGGEQLRRPSLNAPPASPSTLPLPPVPEKVTSTPPTPSVPDVKPATNFTGITIEYQRRRAKEMQDYFLQKKFEEETFQSRIFGWTRKNEIANGRWVMFGLAVGLLTEYATGSDFVEQLKIIVSNLGIAEVD